MGYNGMFISAEREGGNNIINVKVDMLNKYTAPVVSSELVLLYGSRILDELGGENNCMDLSSLNCERPIDSAGLSVLSYFETLNRNARYGRPLIRGANKTVENLFRMTNHGIRFDFI